MLTDRRILLGVSGGVAAYKSLMLARRLVESGAQVRVIMTSAALEFVGAQSFAAVTGRPPETQLFGGSAVSPHTELAEWADEVVVAPATANTLAKAALGLADDLLSATLLACAAPVLFAPAMHTAMWEHSATQRNVATLRADGHIVVGPVSGPLAGGDEGPGRMVEPETVLSAILSLTTRPLEGRRVLVTAGGTREPIDPVRYIGNRSSGKMGHAVAAEAARRGAAVALVTTADLAPPPGVDVTLVETAREMAGEVSRLAPDVEVVVMAAAVADFRPVEPSARKLRRAEGPPELRVEPTPDILASLADLSDRPYLVGFAAEAGPVTGAIEKARTKGVDLVVANDVTAPGSGFGSDTNQVTLIDTDGSAVTWPLVSKQEVARRLWDELAERLPEATGSR